MQAGSIPGECWVHMCYQAIIRYLVGSVLQSIMTDDKVMSQTPTCQGEMGGNYDILSSGPTGVREVFPEAPT